MVKKVDILKTLSKEDIALDSEGRIVILNEEIKAQFEEVDTGNGAELQGVNFYKCNDKCQPK